MKNYHYEMKEQKLTKVIKADSEARSIRADYKRKLHKTTAKMKKL